jgi:hypothetical protein
MPVEMHRLLVSTVISVAVGTVAQFVSEKFVWVAQAVKPVLPNFSGRRASR